VTVTAGLVAMVYGFTEADSDGWSSAVTIYDRAWFTARPAGSSALGRASV